MLTMVGAHCDTIGIGEPHVEEDVNSISTNFVLLLTEFKFSD